MRTAADVGSELDARRGRKITFPEQPIRSVGGRAVVPVRFGLEFGMRSENAAKNCVRLIYDQILSSL